MALAAQKNSKMVPVVIAVLVVVIIAGLGYYVFRTLSTKETGTPTGTSLDTSQLNSTKLQYVQYNPGTAPTPSNTQVGREDPFSAY